MGLFAAVRKERQARKQGPPRSQPLAYPTTWPESLMPVGTMSNPGMRVPSLSVAGLMGLLGAVRKSPKNKLANPIKPTTWPALLMPVGWTVAAHWLGQKEPRSSVAGFIALL